MIFASFKGVQDLSDDIKNMAKLVKNTGQYTIECLKQVHKDEIEGFWNLSVNIPKQDSLHLKAESFLFQME